MNAYIFKIGSYYDETPDHEGVKMKSGAESNLKMISGLLTRSPGHWTVVIIAFIVLIGLLIFLSIYGYKIRHKRQDYNPDTRPLLDGQKRDERQDGKAACLKLWTKNNIIKLAICGTLMIADVIVILCFVFTSSSTFKQAVPSYYFMFKSSIKPHLSSDELADRV